MAENDGKSGDIEREDSTRPTEQMPVIKVPDTEEMERLPGDPERLDTHEMPAVPGDRETLQLDDWGGWDPQDWDGFWRRVQAIDAAEREGAAALAAALAANGLRDRAHLEQVRATFDRHFGEHPEFQQKG